jgi:hypothetical protein
MNVDEQINQFADLLRKLTVEYDIFFSGGRKLPPTNMRFKVDSLVKRLLEEPMSFSQKFRYNQLVAKYSLYRDLWRRNIQEKEEGGGFRSEHEMRQLLQPQRGAVGTEELPPDRLTIVIRDPVAEVSKIGELYRNMQQMRSRFGEKPLELNLEQFVGLVQQKSSEIGAGRAGNGVEFIVYRDANQKRIRFLARANQPGDPDKDSTGSEAPHPINDP